MLLLCSLFTDFFHYCVDVSIFESTFIDGSRMSLSVIETQSKAYWDAGPKGRAKKSSIEELEIEVLIC